MKKTFLLFYLIIFSASLALGRQKDKYYYKLLECAESVEVNVAIVDELCGKLSAEAIESKIKLSLRAAGVEEYEAEKHEIKKHLIFEYIIDGSQSSNGNSFYYVGTCNIRMLMRHPCSDFIEMSTIDNTFSYGELGLNKVEKLKSDYEDFMYVFINDWQISHKKN